MDEQIHINYQQYKCKNVPENGHRIIKPMTLMTKQALNI